MFVVLAGSPYRTIHDLKGKPIAWGARASGFIPLAGFTLEALGLDRDRDFQAVYLERVGDGPAMLRDGRVAALWGGGIGFPSFIEVAKAWLSSRTLQLQSGPGCHPGRYSCSDDPGSTPLREEAGKGIALPVA